MKNVILIGALAGSALLLSALTYDVDAQGRRVGGGGGVKIGGGVVHPGDLIHADKHGVLMVPKEVVPELPEAVRKIEAKERRIIDHCQSKEFSIEKLKDLI